METDTRSWHDNGWRGKREQQFETHNRKPGRGRFWKDYHNRRNRRKGNTIRKLMKDGRININ